MIRFDVEELRGDERRLCASEEGRPVATKTFWSAMRDDPRNSDALSAALSSSGLDAIYWETPRLDSNTRGQPFECVIGPSPSLSRARPDAGPFREHFDAASSDKLAVGFSNLGGESRLVAPMPLQGVERTHYTHLASFLRGTPAAQRVALWRAVADEVARWPRATPCWVSTAGLGVSWLHVRLDPRPKYYRHAPYR